MKKTYTMAESEAYFEAYRHVLAGLQGDVRSHKHDIKSFSFLLSTVYLHKLQTLVLLSSELFFYFTVNL